MYNTDSSSNVCQELKITLIKCYQQFKGIFIAFIYTIKYI